MTTPEQRAREVIDAKLVGSGWVVQSRDEINLSAGCGLAHLAAARVDSRMREGVPSMMHWDCESSRLSPAAS
jgi:hypothetical protein